jgi:hypothetical protein
VSKNHGYEETLRGVEESLDRFGFGKLDFELRVGLTLPPEGSGTLTVSVPYPLVLPDYLDLFLIHDPVRPLLASPSIFLSLPSIPLIPLPLYPSLLFSTSYQVLGNVSRPTELSSRNKRRVSFEA